MLPKKRSKKLLRQVMMVFRLLMASGLLSNKVNNWRLVMERFFDHLSSVQHFLLPGCYTPTPASIYQTIG